MTVAEAFDFQLRPAMFSGQLSLLSFVNYRFGNPTCNLGHRRVNVYILKYSGLPRAVDRELREKHWFSSQLSTNGSHVVKELLPQSDAQFAL
jgi:hypothetical protein